MDWTNPVSSAVSGLFGLLGQKSQYEYNRQLAAQQNQYNIDMWRMQNEYNSPMNQMKRFEAAGLNPNLIYGQGSAGNATHAPQQVVPSAPELSDDMRSLAEAFNIEGLRTAIANRKKAEADAKSSEVDARRNSDEYAGAAEFGQRFRFNPLTGGYELRPQTIEGVTVFKEPYQHYVMQKILENNYRTNSLLVPRSNLIGSTIGLNARKGELLSPQIKMANYSSKYFPVSFWLGNARTGVQTFVPFLNSW